MTERALLLASLFAVAALAGCTARAAETDLEALGPTLDARSAYAIAYDVIVAIDPDAEFLRISGSEGVLPEGILRYWLPIADVKDDGIADGVHGDGLVSSWVADFRTHAGVMSVQVFGDGTPPGTHLGSGHGLADDADDGRTDASSWKVESHDAAGIAAADPDFATHVATYPGAGFVYQYLPYSDKHPTYDWSTFFMGDMEEGPQAMGWAISGNSWIITHFDPAGWLDGMAPTVGVATLDAATAKLTGVESFVPRTMEHLYDGGTYADPVVPEGTDPYIHKVPIEVPAGTGSMSGVLFGSSRNSGVPLGVGVLPDEARLTLYDPAGIERFRSSGDFGFEELEFPNPLPGTWMLTVTHERPVPQEVHVMGWLWGTVPVTAGTQMFGF